MMQACASNYKLLIVFGYDIGDLTDIFFTQFLSPEPVLVYFELDPHLTQLWRAGAIFSSTMFII